MHPRRFRRPRLTFYMIFMLLFSVQALAASDLNEEILLTMGSWRTEDIPQMRRIFDKFTSEHPNIRVLYDPVPAAEYDDVLSAQLEGRTAPDIFYLRSYGVSRTLYERGFLEPLGDLAGLMEYFSPEMLEPWTADGTTYGVPMIATSHGVYYNQYLFIKLGLKVPETWEQLLTVAQTIKDAGVIPFANASGDPWTINEIVFYNIAVNFIGGRKGRYQYLSGERCFDDKNMISAFQALADLSPFLPPNQALLGYTDSLQLFIKGRAAMWFGGSWDIPFLEENNPPFAWSVFAPPPPKGKPEYITFHLDAGMGLNAASPHKEEAKIFLEWMTTPTFGELLGDELPGFFPMHKERLYLKNGHARTFLELNNNRESDIRFVWDRLRDGSPSAYNLTEYAAVEVLNGNLSPTEAARSLQEGLAKWYEPARRCGCSDKIQ